MARTVEEVLKILVDFKGWYKQEFDDDYNPALLKPIMSEILHERLKKFVHRRLGHLPDTDFFSFYDLFLHDEKKPVYSVTENKQKSLEPKTATKKVIEKEDGKKKVN